MEAPEDKSLFICDLSFYLNSQHEIFNILEGGWNVGSEFIHVSST